MSQQNWVLLQKIGALCSIFSVIYIFISVGTTEVRMLPIGLIILGLLLFAISTMFIRHNRIVRVGRQAVIDTGIRLMRGAKKEVIMFGSDMSWASDYEESIQLITSKKKRVIVLYAKSKVKAVINNAKILSDAGAIMIPVPFDTGIRGMLIDPLDHSDAMFYVAHRKLKKNAVVVKEGEKGSSDNYEYHAKIYGMKEDWLLIRAVTRIYEILSSTQGTLNV